MHLGGGKLIHRAIVAALVTSVALTACGQTAEPPASAGYRLFLLEGLDNFGARVTVRDSGTGKIERELPAGTPSPDWSRYYTITHLNGSTQVTAVDPRSGRTLDQLTIPSGYNLTNLGFQGPAVGLSPNGQWLVLTGSKSYADGKPYTTFVVGQSSLAEPFKQVRVPGDMTFDALSNDGQSLYLIETMGAIGHYQVRLFNVGSQSLAMQPVVDKREPTEPMNGVRGESLPAADANYVFTVYARNEGPFIHALPLDQPVAWCIELPTSSASNWDEQFHWSLAANSDNSKLYAVNGSSGVIAEMSPASLPKISRIVRFNPNSQSLRPAGSVVQASARGLAIGGAVLSSDGRTLFALGQSGILAIETATLRVRARYLEEHDILSLRLSADGKWLYGADRGNRVLQIDPQTGLVAGDVMGVDNPWAVLFATSKS
jgi:hypothetical protein